MTATQEPPAAPQARTRSDVELAQLGTIGPAELLRIADAGRALAAGAVREAIRRNAALPLAPRTQTPRALAATIRRAFEDLGPAYIKFGQIIASSPGLFPEVLNYEFRRCLDRVPAEPTSVVRARIAAELGAPPERIFDSFDMFPMASASIAQVHAAKLDGRELVVKVRRPGLVRRFRHDLRLLHRLAVGLERSGGFLEVFNPVGIVEDFARTLYEEMDFEREAASMRRFEANLRAYGDNDMVDVPEVIDDLTTERVLTMARVRGVPPDDHATILGEWGLEVEPLFQNAIRAWVEAALVHGHFHGDLHAGNLLVDEGGRVTFLDFGIMGTMDGDHRRIMRALLPTIVIDEDWERAARLLIRLSPGTPDAEEDVDVIAADLERVVGSFVTTRMGEMSYGGVLNELLVVAQRHGRAIARENVLVAKQFLYFERYAKLLAPGYAPFSDERIFETLLGASADESEGESAAHRRPLLRIAPPPVQIRDDARIIPRDSVTTFSWQYDSQRPPLTKLYEKAKRGQWNVTTDLDWSIEVDPEEAGAGFGAYLSMIPSDSLAAMGDAERADAGLQLSSWMNSQFLHGEQGALMATAKIVEMVPFSEAKLYGATQVIDEARHVEAYSRYLREKLHTTWPVNDNLAVLLDMIMADSRWDVTYLGMQIVVEGIALAAFGLMYRFSTEPLIKEITRLIMSDEARHVAFGTLSLAGIYDDMTAAEVADREDFVLEAAYLMRDRFLAADVWTSLGVPADDPLLDLDQSPMAQVFRRLIFAKITPNLRKLGLMSDRLLDGLVRIGAVDDTLERLS